MKKIKAPKPSFKLIKRKLREILMNNPEGIVTENGSVTPINAAAAQAPVAPQILELTDKQQYEHITSFLGQLMTQFTFSKWGVKGARLESLVTDLRAWVENRLSDELQAGE